MSLRTATILGGLLLQVCSSLGQQAAPNPLEILIRSLGKVENPVAQASILKGLNASIKGKRLAAAPAGWDELYIKLQQSPSGEVRQQARTLAAAFGGGEALDQMRATLADASADLQSRKAAIDSLTAAPDAAALPILRELARAAGDMRSAAIRGLAAYEEPTIARQLIDDFAVMGASEKQEALQTLLARSATARLLLSAIRENRIPRAAISAPIARQLQGMRDPEIDGWLSNNWGAVKSSSADKQAQIAKFEEFLTPDLIRQADASHGRAVFQQTCAVCHEMFGVGGKIGPELPGSYEDIDYLLQNILDPNALIGKDYQQTFVNLENGQSASGIIVAEDEQMVTLKTFGGVATFARGDITELQVSEQSIMPEGLLNPLDEESVRDLFAYLRQKKQVPMLVTPLTASEFFNGRDLNTWRSSETNWKVEAGMIVGRSNGRAVTALASEMIANDYKLTAEVRLIGVDAVGELVLRGLADANPFVGASLSFGRNLSVSAFRYKDGSPEAVPGAEVIRAGEWSTLEITAKGQSVQVIVNGAAALELRDMATSRTAPAIYLAGEGAELAIRNLVIESLVSH